MPLDPCCCMHEHRRAPSAPTSDKPTCFQRGVEGDEAATPSMAQRAQLDAATLNPLEGLGGTNLLSAQQRHGGGVPYFLCCLHLFRPDEARSAAHSMHKVINAHAADIWQLFMVIPSRHTSIAVPLTTAADGTTHPSVLSCLVIVSADAETRGKSGVRSQPVLQVHKQMAHPRQLYVCHSLCPDWGPFLCSFCEQQQAPRPGTQAPVRPESAHSIQRICSAHADASYAPRPSSLVTACSGQRFEASRWHQALGQLSAAPLLLTPWVSCCLSAKATSLDVGLRLCSRADMRQGH